MYQNSPRTLYDIKDALSNENETYMKPKLAEINNSIMKLTDRVAGIEKTCSDMEKSVAYNDARIEEMVNTTIPDIQNENKHITSEIVLSIIEEQTHKRKWGIIISGLEGKAGEIELDTRKKTVDFATNILKVSAPFIPDGRRMAACHRLRHMDVHCVFY